MDVTASACAGRAVTGQASVAAGSLPGLRDDHRAIALPVLTPAGRHKDGQRYFGLAMPILRPQN